MKITLPSPEVRQYLYLVATAILAVLVGYNIVDAGDVPMWLSLAAAIFGVGATGLAGIAVNQQRSAGLYDEPAGRHRAPDDESPKSDDK